MSDFIDYDPAEKPRPVMQTRNEIIEECAKVVDQYAAPYQGSTPEAIARAIRAKKSTAP